MNYGTTAVTFDKTTFTALGRSLAGNSAVAGLVRRRVTASCALDPGYIRAMEGAGVIRTLAEPN